MAEAIDSEQWEAATSAFRTPLGRIVGRRPSAMQYLQSDPTEIALQLSSTFRIFQEKQVALPYREWILLQCQARFQHDRGVMLETLQLVKDGDGTWKVIGIRIQESR